MGHGGRNQSFKNLNNRPDAVNFLDTTPRLNQSPCARCSFRAFPCGGHISDVKVNLLTVLKVMPFSNYPGGQKSAFPLWKIGQSCLIR
jgi:hypothetical protein